MGQLGALLRHIADLPAIQAIFDNVRLALDAEAAKLYKGTRHHSSQVERLLRTSILRAVYSV